MTDRERKLYVVTRRDLDPSLRAVMAIHVAADVAYRLGQKNTVEPDEWTEHGPPITLMTVRNRARLEAVAAKFTRLGTPPLTYSDPDLNDGVCAIAFYLYHWNDDRARMARFAEYHDTVHVTEPLTNIAINNIDPAASVDPTTAYAVCLCGHLGMAHRARGGACINDHDVPCLGFKPRQPTPPPPAVRQPTPPPPYGAPLP